MNIRIGLVFFGMECNNRDGNCPELRDRFQMKLEEIQESVMQLTDAQRATLAADLLSTLPGMLVDEDDGIAEARRRSRELAEDPSVGCSWEEIRRDLGR